MVLIFNSFFLYLCVRLSPVFLNHQFTNMFREKVNRLLSEFGIKQEALIQVINSNRVSFTKKMKDNSFSEEEKAMIINKYGSLL